MRSALIFLICGFLVAGWASTGTAKNNEIKGRQLSGAEIKKFYPGAKVNALSTEDYPLVSNGDVTVEYSPNGTLYGQHRDGYTDNGTWWVKDNKLCRQWFQWVSGFSRCYMVTLEKGDFIRNYNDDGSFHASGKLLEGPGLTQ